METYFWQDISDYKYIHWDVTDCKTRKYLSVDMLDVDSQ